MHSVLQRWPIRVLICMLLNYVFVKNSSCVPGAGNKLYEELLIRNRVHLRAVLFVCIPRCIWQLKTLLLEMHVSQAW